MKGGVYHISNEDFEGRSVSKAEAMAFVQFSKSVLNWLSLMHIWGAKPFLIVSQISVMLSCETEVLRPRRS